MASITDLVPSLPASGNFNTFTAANFYKPVGQDGVDMLLFPQFIAQGAKTISLQLQTLYQNMNPTDPEVALKAQGLMAAYTTTLGIAANTGDAIRKVMENIVQHIA